jgi:hypothetical protein
MTTANEYEKLVKNVVENKTVHWADSPLSGREGRALISLRGPFFFMKFQ